MDEKQILAKKQTGDTKLVAEMIGVSYFNADVILKRPKSKRYAKAIEALRKIIENREMLLSEARGINTDCQ